MVNKKKLPLPPRNCGVCGVEYQPKRKSQVICTMKCFRALRQKQRDAEFATQATAPTVTTVVDRRTCARCGGPFTGDPLFITCPSCRRPCSNSTGGCQRWSDVATAVGIVKAIDRSISE